MTRTRNETDGWRRIGLSESDRHRLLASKRRRTVLDILEERTLPLDLDVLAAALVERAPDDHSSAAAERVELTLYHNHLPLMDDLGVIDFDRQRTAVETYRSSLLEESCAES